VNNWGGFLKAGVSNKKKFCTLLQKTFDMENLFSYGTLQLEQVQLELFGRILKMEPDALVGYKKEKIKIKVESVVSLSGEEEHVIISYSGNDSDVIEGAVLSITKEELEHADKYETNDYKRITVSLKSGKASWVYVKNDNK
jgi:gamma-glutamylcyclotransferase (GGCT)/AIG2-like uncharacterized protein YtfP